MSKNIEVELRSQFKRSDYERLYKYLKENAQDLGEDDKEMHFYIFPDKLLKVVNNITKQNSKISLKLNKIGNGNSFQEYELYIDQKDTETAIKIAEELTKGQVEYQYAYNLRDNFSFKDVEIALKYSNTWGYHAEFEIMVSEQAEVEEAEKIIHELSHFLGLSIMSQEDLQNITRLIDKGYREYKYIKNDLALPTRPK